MLQINSLILRLLIVLFLAASCFHASSKPVTATIGDDHLKIVLTYGDDGLTESEFNIDGTPLPGMNGVAWSAILDESAADSSGGQVKLDSGSSEKAQFSAENNAFSWTISYALSGRGRIMKAMELSPKREFLLKYVNMWQVKAPTAPTVSKTRFQDIAAFYRETGRGLFTSLDFPYSNIQTTNGVTRVSYPPFEKLAAGKTYMAHTLTFGATKLTGRQRYGYDEGEIDAMDTYIQEHVPPKFERPMTVFCSIINDYTQPEKNWIFYTMKDHPSWCFNPDLLKDDMSIMQELGIEYYQVCPGVFDWTPNDPPRDYVRSVVADAKSRGLRIGDYTPISVLFCPHFNDHNNSLDKPDWLLVDEEGKNTGGFCLGNPDYADVIARTVPANCRKFGFEMNCLDFLMMKPCYATNHGHPAGHDSLYAQVKNIVKIIEAIQAVSPQMMTWTNAGEFNTLLPKLAWYNPNLYLTDPYIAYPFQDLNMTRLLDEARRQQMVSLHSTTFLPYRNFTNFQYFLIMNSITPDFRNYEFGVLSTLAVTPNLGLGEIRLWLDRLGRKERDHVVAFYKKWTSFIAKNYDLWKKTYNVGEEPGYGALEIYGHAKGNHGYIFLVNPNFWDRTVEVPLDASLGFDASGACELRELYPLERLRLTAQGPFAQFGSRLPISVPAHQVVVIEVNPAPGKITQPRLYGVPGTLTASNGKYTIKTEGPQGTTATFAVLLPKGADSITSVSVHPDIPHQAERQWAPTPIKLTASDGQGVQGELTFRRQLTATQLLDWRVRPGTLEAGDKEKWRKGWDDGDLLHFPLFIDTTEKGIVLPLEKSTADALQLGPLANFCGVKIDNALSEIQETWIDLKSGGASVPAGKLATNEVPPVKHPIHSLAKDSGGSWWLSTDFDIPFVYFSQGFEPFFDQHWFAIFPLLRQHDVKKVTAWINGQSIDVRDYTFPRNRSLGCYYADLIPSPAHAGRNKLVVYLEF